MRKDLKWEPASRPPADGKRLLLKLKNGSVFIGIWFVDEFMEISRAGAFPFSEKNPVVEWLPLELLES